MNINVCSGQGKGSCNIRKNVTELMYLQISIISEPNSNQVIFQSGE